jgi:alkyl hydroperoxide reductase subunit AhpC
MLTVGDEFPQFSVQACTGTEKEDIKLLTSADYSGKVDGVLFLPKRFYVCLSYGIS